MVHVNKYWFNSYCISLLHTKHLGYKCFNDGIPICPHMFAVVYSALPYVIIYNRDTGDRGEKHHIVRPTHRVWWKKWNRQHVSQKTSEELTGPSIISLKIWNSQAQRHHAHALFDKMRIWSVCYSPLLTHCSSTYWLKKIWHCQDTWRHGL